MRVRFRIADLMVMIALMAVGFFTFRLDSDLFAVVVWATFLGALGTATAVARLGRGDRSRFGLGFALFGWTWLVCGLRFGFLPTNAHLLQHSLVGFGVALLSGYAVARLAPGAAG
jgi:hypothetical protein